MKQRIFKGLLAGLICNAIGILICIFIIAQTKGIGFSETFNTYWNSDALWMILTLGALPNLLLFFALLKRNKEYEARGVVMATLLAAITTYILYFNVF